MALHARDLAGRQFERRRRQDPIQTGRCAISQRLPPFFELSTVTSCTACDDAEPWQSTEGLLSPRDLWQQKAFDTQLAYHLAGTIAGSNELGWRTDRTFERPLIG